MMTQETAEDISPPNVMRTQCELQTLARFMSLGRPTTDEFEVLQRFVTDCKM